ncbi:MAG: DNA repair protein RecN [Prevotella sp.]|nr:DNA repair protein RecN [Prevotella sp.]
MITHLYIKNFTLIDKLDIDFYPGFSVITGETGAGKSIILGAIGLLLGQRAETKQIKQGCDKCSIEAHFNLAAYGMKPFFDDNDIDYDAEDCIIRREIMASGKSRAFINDTPTSLTLLKTFGEQLMDVHSQHKNLLLQKQDFQLSTVDIIAENQALTAEYAGCFSSYKKALQRVKALRQEIDDNLAQKNFLEFQYQELSAANLQAGELEELEQSAETMSHSEDIKTALYKADNALNNDDSGILTNLKTAVNSLHDIADVLPGARQLEERTQSCMIELKDIAQEIGHELDNIDYDPAELDAINSRLDKLYDLQKKYRKETIEELIEMRDELHAALENIENSDEAMEEAQRTADRLAAQCAEIAGKLTATRKKAAKTIEKNMQESLKRLGMPNVEFTVSISATELGDNGGDRVEFLFSANKNVPLQPISQVASGGEIARVMLSLKAMISGTVKLPTIIFDEIDTGVSGKVAEQMAKMMREMGNSNRQVISITHLPQIAALGTTHYKVYKEDSNGITSSHMTLLNHNQRVNEIAQMLSGSDITQAAVDNAKELLTPH